MHSKNEKSIIMKAIIKKRSYDEKWNTPTVFPKPARACEGAMKRGETRVKGSRAIHSPDELVGLVRDEDKVRERDERPSASPCLNARAVNRELLNRASAGSNVHSSHLSKVALVSPYDEFKVPISSETAAQVVPDLDLP